MFAPEEMDWWPSTAFGTGDLVRRHPVIEEPVNRCRRRDVGGGTFINPRMMDFPTYSTRWGGSTVSHMSEAVEVVEVPVCCPSRDDRPVACCRFQPPRTVVPYRPPTFDPPRQAPPPPRPPMPPQRPPLPLPAPRIEAPYVPPPQPPQQPYQPYRPPPPPPVPQYEPYRPPPSFPAVQENSRRNDFPAVSQTASVIAPPPVVETASDEPQRPWLGMSVKWLDDLDQGGTNNVAVVHEVVPNSPAWKAGIKVDDQVEYWETTKIDSEAVWKSKVTRMQIGDVINMGIHRNKRDQRVLVRIEGTTRAMGSRVVSSSTAVHTDN